MNKRVFSIDEKCFIIYTGLSSADNKAFLRIGNSKAINKVIQSHIKYIVVPDVKLLDIESEIENIKYTTNIKYICNKVNQDILFSSLREKEIDIDKIMHRDLSKKLENINKLENKKHFFTIFYENKNLKLLYDDEIFFDLFESKSKKWNYEKEQKRLLNFIKLLDKLNSSNKHSSFSIDDIVEVDKYITLENSMMFILQRSNRFHLNPAMFAIKRKSKKGAFSLKFNCSYLFNIGEKISLVILDKGKKKILLNGTVSDGEVLEHGILYQYNINFPVSRNINEFYAVMQFYDFLLNED